MCAEASKPFATPADSVKSAKILLGTHHNTYVEWQCCARNPIFATHFGTPHDQQEAARSLSGCEGYGEFPTLGQYKLFKKYLRSSGQLRRGSTKASESTLCRTTKCQHPLHPGIPDKELEYCPVCITQDICESLQRIAKLWRPLGGIKDLGEDCGELSFKSRHEAILYRRLQKLWSFEKVQWADCLETYETWTCKEAAWDAEYCKNHGCSDSELPPYVREVHNNWSSMQACVIAWENCPYPKPGADLGFIPGSKLGGSKLRPVAEGLPPIMSEHRVVASTLSALASDELFTPKSKGSDVLTSCVSRSSDLPSPPLTPPLHPANSDGPRSDEDLPCSSTKNKAPPQVIRKVTFTPDVIEGPYRHRGFYNRRSPFYQPGKYSCLEDIDWLDIGSMNDEDTSDDDSSDSDNSATSSYGADDGSNKSNAEELEVLDGNSREILLNIIESPSSKSSGKVSTEEPTTSAGVQAQLLMAEYTRHQVQSWLAGLPDPEPLDGEASKGSLKRGREDDLDASGAHDNSPPRKKQLT